MCRLLLQGSLFLLLFITLLWARCPLDPDAHFIARLHSLSLGLSKAGQTWPYWEVRVIYVMEKLLLWLIHALSLFHTLSCTLSFSLSYTHTCTHACTRLLSSTLAHSHPLAHSHTHTHLLTHSFARALQLLVFHSNWGLCIELFRSQNHVVMFPLEKPEPVLAQGVCSFPVPQERSHFTAPQKRLGWSLVYWTSLIGQNSYTAF